MKDFRAVDLAITMAKKRRDEAAKARAAAVQRQQMAVSQLDQLEAYAAEIQAKWMARAQVSVSPTLMFHHHQFLGKLDQAIVFQKGVIHGHDQRVESTQQTLVEADQRVSRFEHLLAARKAELQVATHRLQQRQMDEWAARSVSQRKRPLGAKESV